MYRPLNIEIRQFDVLVHPYFMDCEDNLGTVKTAPYQELAQAWNNRFGELEKVRDSVLLYYSSLEIPANPENAYRIGWEEEERLRTSRLERQFGQRVIVFTEGLTLPQERPLLDTLRNRNLSWNPQEAKMLVYGEYQESCVQNWGEAVKLYLKIQEHNYNNQRPDLSMTDERARRVYRALG